MKFTLDLISFFIQKKFSAQNGPKVKNFNLRGEGLLRIYDFDVVLRGWKAAENDFFILAKNFAYGNQWSLRSLPFLEQPKIQTLIEP